MKKQFLLAIFMLGGIMATNAQTYNMKVLTNDGKAQTFATKDVKEVIFEAIPEKKPDVKKVDHLVIKEVFYAGHQYKEMGYTKNFKKAMLPKMYNKDQYIVIYNPTDKDVSLANMALALNVIDPTEVKTMEGNSDFRTKYYGVQALAVFPEGEKSTIKAGETKVIAAFAQEHAKKYAEVMKAIADEDGEDLAATEGTEVFFNTSKADFEWVNKTFADSDDKSFCNDNVPDLITITKNGGEDDVLKFPTTLPESFGLALIQMPWKVSEYEAKRNEINHEIKVTGGGSGFYVTEIPLTSVIDAITVCPTKAHVFAPCEKVDKGFAGVSETVIKNMKTNEQVKYTGKSVIRKSVDNNIVDTDNSTNDFEVKEATLK